MVRLVEMGETKIVVSDGPEVQMTRVLSDIPDDQSARFAMAVPQACALLSKFAYRSVSLIKDELLPVVIARHDKSVFSCALISSIDGLIQDVEDAGRKVGCPPDSEGLLSRMCVDVLDEQGVDARLKTEPVPCRDTVAATMVLYNARTAFDEFKQRAGEHAAIAYVTLVAEGNDGVIVLPVVYGYKASSIVSDFLSEGKERL